jgi:uncharacterized protein
MQQTYRRERLLAEIRVGLEYYPVIALMGARQVGKTTLALEYAGSDRIAPVHYDLERPADLAALSADPGRLSARFHGR